MSRNYRNSRSHKLKITWIPIWYDKKTAGHIGMTFCPGKVQPWSMTGGWHRDLDLDLRELKKANVGHVISLIGRVKSQKFGQKITIQSY
jgi:ADP-ribosyl-[dinitrogen reductase] hydrolase